MLSGVRRWSFFNWLIAAVGAAIVALVVAEAWQGIKSGALFDFLDYIGNREPAGHLVREDLVDARKQSIAEWTLSVCVIGAVVISYFTRVLWEDWLYPFFSGMVYGYAFGIGILLAGFDRFRDIHLAVGTQQYQLAGAAIIATILLAFAIRIRDRLARRRGERPNDENAN